MRGGRDRRSVRCLNTPPQQVIRNTEAQSEQGAGNTLRPSISDTRRGKMETKLGIKFVKNNVKTF